MRLIGLLLACGLLAAAAEDSTFRFMTYNIHHGEGPDARVDLERIAQVIREEKADIVALQEVDLGLERSHALDMPEQLARLTGMSCLFSNNFHVGPGQYGNALLTRFPVRSWTNSHLAKLGSCEQRGVLQAELEVGGRVLRIACTHLDAGREDTERLHQARQLQSLLARMSPLLLGGDFNATPQSAVHRQLSETWIDLWPLVGDGPGNTIPVPNATRRIDYVWIEPNSPLRPRRAWIPKALASDHLPLVVEFKF
jgi:endonuclease/exonuclease/phosphatase family metal-dependent hydrolase